jgi:hypothetical protein
VTETESEKPRRRKNRGMPAEEMALQYPSLSYLAGPAGKATERAWVAVFNARPDAMHSLLADFIKQVHATPGRIGQRPMPKEEQVDFQHLVYGEEENHLPLIEVLPKIMTMSERAMCSRINMSKTQWRRVVAGEYDPNVNELREIAKALRKPPTFFVEYRKAMAVAAFLNLLEERPGIATLLYRKYLEVRM